MKIGIIGAGRMAQSVAWLATRAGYQVMLSNSRGPETIQALCKPLGCEVGRVDEARLTHPEAAALHVDEVAAGAGQQNIAASNGAPW